MEEGSNGSPPHLPGSLSRRRTRPLDSPPLSSISGSTSQPQSQPHPSSYLQSAIPPNITLSPSGARTLLHHLAREEEIERDDIAATARVLGTIPSEGWAKRDALEKALGDMYTGWGLTVGWRAAIQKQRDQDLASRLKQQEGATQREASEDETKPSAGEGQTTTQAISTNEASLGSSTSTTMVNILQKDNNKNAADPLNVLTIGILGVARTIEKEVKGDEDISGQLLNVIDRESKVIQAYRKMFSIEDLASDDDTIDDGAISSSMIKMTTLNDPLRIGINPGKGGHVTSPHRKEEEILEKSLRRHQHYDGPRSLMMIENREHGHDKSKVDHGKSSHLEHTHQPHFPKEAVGRQRYVIPEKSAQHLINEAVTDSAKTFVLSATTQDKLSSLSSSSSSPSPGIQIPQPLPSISALVASSHSSPHLPRPDPHQSRKRRYRRRQRTDAGGQASLATPTWLNSQNGEAVTSLAITTTPRTPTLVTGLTSSTTSPSTAAPTSPTTSAFTETASTSTPPTTTTTTSFLPQMPRRPVSQAVHELRMRRLGLLNASISTHFTRAASARDVHAKYDPQNDQHVQTNVFVPKGSIAQHSSPAPSSTLPNATHLSKESNAPVGLHAFDMTETARATNEPVDISSSSSNDVLLTTQTQQHSASPSKVIKESEVDRSLRDKYTTTAALSLMSFHDSLLPPYVSASTRPHKLFPGERPRVVTLPDDVPPPPPVNPHSPKSRRTRRRLHPPHHLPQQHHVSSGDQTTVPQSQIETETNSNKEVIGEVDIAQMYLHRRAMRRRLRRLLYFDFEVAAHTARWNKAVAERLDGSVKRFIERHDGDTGNTGASRGGKSMDDQQDLVKYHLAQLRLLDPQPVSLEALHKVGLSQVTDATTDTSASVTSSHSSRGKGAIIDPPHNTAPFLEKLGSQAAELVFQSLKYHPMIQLWLKGFWTLMGKRVPPVDPRRLARPTSPISHTAFTLAYLMSSAEFEALFMLIVKELHLSDASTGLVGLHEFTSALWDHASGHGLHITYQQFCKLLLEIVSQRARTAHPNEYVSFLRLLFARVSKIRELKRVSSSEPGSSTTDRLKGNDISSKDGEDGEAVEDDEEESDREVSVVEDDSDSEKKGKRKVDVSDDDDPLSDDDMDMPEILKWTPSGTVKVVPNESQSTASSVSPSLPSQAPLSSPVKTPDTHPPNVKTESSSDDSKVGTALVSTKPTDSVNPTTSEEASNSDHNAPALATPEIAIAEETLPSSLIESINGSSGPVASLEGNSQPAVDQTSGETVVSERALDTQDAVDVDDSPISATHITKAANVHSIPNESTNIPTEQDGTSHVGEGDSSLKGKQDIFPSVESDDSLSSLPSLPQPDPGLTIALTSETSSDTDDTTHPHASSKSHQDSLDGIAHPSASANQPISATLKSVAPTSLKQTSGVAEPQLSSSLPTNEQPLGAVNVEKGPSQAEADSGATSQQLSTTTKTSKQPRDTKKVRERALLADCLLQQSRLTKMQRAIIEGHVDTGASDDSGGRRSASGFGKGRGLEALTAAAAALAKVQQLQAERQKVSRFVYRQVHNVRIQLEKQKTAKDIRNIGTSAFIAAENARKIWEAEKREKESLAALHGSSENGTNENRSGLDSTRWRKGDKLAKIVRQSQSKPSLMGGPPSQNNSVFVVRDEDAARLREQRKALEHEAMLRAIDEAVEQKMKEEKDRKRRLALLGRTALQGHNDEDGPVSLLGNLSSLFGDDTPSSSPLLSSSSASQMQPLALPPSSSSAYLHRPKLPASFVPFGVKQPSPMPVLGLNHSSGEGDQVDAPDVNNLTKLGKMDPLSNVSSSNDLPIPFHQAGLNHPLDRGRSIVGQGGGRIGTNQYAMQSMGQGRVGMMGSESASRGGDKENLSDTDSDDDDDGEGSDASDSFVSPKLRAAKQRLKQLRDKARLKARVLASMGQTLALGEFRQDMVKELQMYAAASHVLKTVKNQINQAKKSSSVPSSSLPSTMNRPSLSRQSTSSTLRPSLSLRARPSISSHPPSSDQVLSDAELDALADPEAHFERIHSALTATSPSLLSSRSPTEQTQDGQPQIDPQTGKEVASFMWQLLKDLREDVLNQPLPPIEDQSLATQASQPSALGKRSGPNTSQVGRPSVSVGGWKDAKDPNVWHALFDSARPKFETPRSLHVNIAAAYAAPKSPPITGSSPYPVFRSPQSTVANQVAGPNQILQVIREMMPDGTIRIRTVAIDTQLRPDYAGSRYGAAPLDAAQELARIYMSKKTERERERRALLQHGTSRKRGTTQSDSTSTKPTSSPGTSSTKKTQRRVAKEIEADEAQRLSKARDWKILRRGSVDFRGSRVSDLAAAGIVGSDGEDEDEDEIDEDEDEDDDEDLTDDGPEHDGTNLDGAEDEEGPNRAEATKNRPRKKSGRSKRNKHRNASVSGPSAELQGKSTGTTDGVKEEDTGGEGAVHESRPDKGVNDNSQPQHSDSPERSPSEERKRGKMKKKKGEGQKGQSPGKSRSEITALRREAVNLREAMKRLGEGRVKILDTSIHSDLQSALEEKVSMLTGDKMSITRARSDRKGKGKHKKRDRATGLDDPDASSSHPHEDKQVLEDKKAILDRVVALGAIVGEDNPLLPELKLEIDAKLQQVAHGDTEDTVGDVTAVDDHAQKALDNGSTSLQTSTNNLSSKEDESVADAKAALSPSTGEVNQTMDIEVARSQALDDSESEASDLVSSSTEMVSSCCEDEEADGEQRNVSEPHTTHGGAKVRRLRQQRAIEDKIHPSLLNRSSLDEGTSTVYYDRTGRPLLRHDPGVDMFLTDVATARLAYEKLQTSEVGDKEGETNVLPELRSLDIDKEDAIHQLNPETRIGQISCLSYPLPPPIPSTASVLSLMASINQPQARSSDVPTASENIDGESSSDPPMISPAETKMDDLTNANTTEVPTIPEDAQPAPMSSSNANPDALRRFRCVLPALYAIAVPLRGEETETDDEEVPYFTKLTGQPQHQQELNYSPVGDDRLLDHRTTRRGWFRAGTRRPSTLSPCYGGDNQQEDKPMDTSPSQTSTSGTNAKQESGVESRRTTRREVLEKLEDLTTDSDYEDPPLQVTSPSPEAEQPSLSSPTQVSDSVNDDLKARSSLSSRQHPITEDMSPTTTLASLERKWADEDDAIYESELRLLAFRIASLRGDVNRGSSGLMTTFTSAPGQLPSGIYRRGQGASYPHPASSPFHVIPFHEHLTMAGDDIDQDLSPTADAGTDATTAASTTSTVDDPSPSIYSLPVDSLYPPLLPHDNTLPRVRPRHQNRPLGASVISTSSSLPQTHDWLSRAPHDLIRSLPPGSSATLTLLSLSAMKNAIKDLERGLMHVDQASSSASTFTSSSSSSPLLMLSNSPSVPGPSQLERTGIPGSSIPHQKNADIALLLPNPNADKSMLTQLEHLASLSVNEKEKEKFWNHFYSQYRSLEDAIAPKVASYDLDVGSRLQLGKGKGKGVASMKKNDAERVDEGKEDLGGNRESQHIDHDTSSNGKPFIDPFYYRPEDDLLWRMGVPQALDKARLEEEVDPTTLQGRKDTFLGSEGTCDNVPVEVVSSGVSKAYPEGGADIATLDTDILEAISEEGVDRGHSTLLTLTQGINTSENDEMKGKWWKSAPVDKLRVMLHDCMLTNEEAKLKAQWRARCAERRRKRANEREKIRAQLRKEAAQMKVKGARERQKQVLQSIMLSTTANNQVRRNRHEDRAKEVRIIEAERAVMRKKKNTHSINQEGESNQSTDDGVGEPGYVPDATTNPADAISTDPTPTLVIDDSGATQGVTAHEGVMDSRKLRSVMEWKESLGRKALGLAMQHTPIAGCMYCDLQSKSEALCKVHGLPLVSPLAATMAIRLVYQALSSKERRNLRRWERRMWRWLRRARRNVAIARIAASARGSKSTSISIDGMDFQRPSVDQLRSEMGKETTPYAMDLYTSTSLTEPIPNSEQLNPDPSLNESSTSHPEQNRQLLSVRDKAKRLRRRIRRKEKRRAHIRRALSTLLHDERENHRKSSLPLLPSTEREDALGTISADVADNRDGDNLPDRGEDDLVVTAQAAVPTSLPEDDNGDDDGGKGDNNDEHDNAYDNNYADDGYVQTGEDQSHTSPNLAEHEYRDLHRQSVDNPDHLQSLATNDRCSSSPQEMLQHTHSEVAPSAQPPHPTHIDSNSPELNSLSDPLSLPPSFSTGSLFNTSRRSQEPKDADTKLLTTSHSASTISSSTSRPSHHSHSHVDSGPDLTFLCSSRRLIPSHSLATLFQASPTSTSPNNPTLTPASISSVPPSSSSPSLLPTSHRRLHIIPRGGGFSLKSKVSAPTHLTPSSTFSPPSLSSVDPRPASHSNTPLSAVTATTPKLISSSSEPLIDQNRSLSRTGIDAQSIASKADGLGSGKRGAPANVALTPSVSQAVLNLQVSKRRGFDAIANIRERREAVLERDSRWQRKDSTDQGRKITVGGEEPSMSRRVDAVGHDKLNKGVYNREEMKRSGPIVNEQTSLTAPRPPYVFDEEGLLTLYPFSHDAQIVLERMRAERDGIPSMSAPPRVPPVPGFPPRPPIKQTMGSATSRTASTHATSSHNRLSSSASTPHLLPSTRSTLATAGSSVFTSHTPRFKQIPKYHPVKPAHDATGNGADSLDHVLLWGSIPIHSQKHTIMSVRDLKWKLSLPRAAY